MTCRWKFIHDRNDSRVLFGMRGHLLFVCGICLSLSLPPVTHAAEVDAPATPAAADTLRQQAVMPGKPPVASVEIPSVSAQEGHSFRYDLSGRFRDAAGGDSLRYAVALPDGGPLPSWLSFNGDRALIEGTPSGDDVGNRRIRLSATGRGGVVAEGILSIEVIPSVLEMADFLRMVMERNGEIVAERYEWKLNENLAFAARGAYEPVLKASTSREWNRIENTAQEITSKGIGAFKENNNLYKTSLEGLTPLGGSYRVGYDLTKKRNSVIDAYQNQPSYGVHNPEFVTLFGVSLSQPLMKGAGPKVTNANIRIARANADIAYEGFRKVSLETAAKAIEAYWQCYGAQEKLRMRRRSLELASKFLELGRKRYAAGKIPYTAVMDAESGSLLRKAMVSEAEQDELTARKKLMSLYGNYASSVDPAFVRVSVQPEMLKAEPGKDALPDKVYETNPKYRSAMRTVEREKSRMEYADNQRWPKLDVKASYGLNGLDSSLATSWDKALTQDYLSWSVGVVLEIPILGDIKARNEYHASRLRKLQAEKRLETERIGIVNDLEILAGQVRSTYLQLARYNEAVAISAERLRIEEVRLRYGKSDIGQLLEREENLLKARESFLDSMLKYQGAMAQLSALDGSLPGRYGLSASRNQERDAD